MSSIADMFTAFFVVSPLLAAALRVTVFRNREENRALFLTSVAVLPFMAGGMGPFWLLVFGVTNVVAHVFAAYAAYFLMASFKWTSWLMMFATGLDLSAKDQSGVVRGTEIVSEKALNNYLRKVPSAARLGGIAVPINLEPQHFLLSGATGTGKSQAFRQLLNSARKRSHAAIVSDLGGEFISRYYRPGHDVIVNPFDSRSVDWSPFAEMRQSYDAARLAASMIPEGHGETKEWNGYARNILETILERCFENDTATNGALCWYAFGAPVAEVAELCKGSPAASYFADGAERMLGSIRGILSSYIKAYTYLKPDTGRDGFSIREHMAKGNDSWLFISYRDDQLQALKAMISAQLDVASSAILSMDANQARRVWFALDEFATLGYLNSIEPLLTKGRKNGACVILGYQSIAQPRATYGDKQAQTILGSLGTWLVLKQPDADSAEYMSKYFGDEEARRFVTSNNDNGDTSSTGTSEQIVRQRAIMGSELANLANLTGLLNLAGDAPPAWTTIPIDQTPISHPSFEDRAHVRAMRIERPAALALASAPLPVEAEKAAQPAPAAINVDDL